MHPELGLPEVRKLWQTEGLFSDHYLKARLQRNSWWPTDAGAEPIWKYCKELYEKRYLACAKNNEAFTRQELLDKILEKLGFAWTDNLGLPDQDSEPDYILFSSAEEKEKVIEASKQQRYAASVGILEAKKVNHPLSQISKHQGRYPHQQIRDYLNEAQVLTWSILTNGNEWRLYTRDCKPSQFFGLNFEVAIKSLADFKFFLCLFSAAAFARDAQGKCRLDQIREVALATQAELEADLRERIFTIVEILANGFAERTENNITDADLPRLYENCLIYLYRLLFILYAEGRLLLPVEPKSRKYYKQLSLARLLTPLKNYSEYDSQTQTRFYRDLHALSMVINGSDKKANDEFGVPRFNGGLFDPDHYPLLQQWAVADAVLAEVLRQLMFTPEKSGQKFVPFESVDYSDLSVQQLGSIYEGLLEHHFVRDNGKLKLQTDKGERKATGTYYTPDYIVKYIVENTLGPLLAEIEQHADVKAGKDNSFANEILKLNICDPAMGSGHFMVEATVYLADHIVYHPTTRYQAQFKPGESQEGTEIAYWRRRVVEACIYGVDLNPLAVELAKLSLWLTTIASDQPLNFLDHHLRCGNSLIGARLDQLGSLPKKKGKRAGRPVQQILVAGSSFKNSVSEVILQIKKIETEASDNLAVVKNKEARWREQIEPLLVNYKSLADLWTSSFFGNELDEDKYTEAAQQLLAQKGNQPRPHNSGNFFHWELEFPEVFFAEDGIHKADAGFDAVVSNPPYIGFKAAKQGDREYLRNIFVNVFDGKGDILYYFLDQSVRIVAKHKFVGMITSRYWLEAEFAKKLRKEIGMASHVETIFDFGELTIFHGVGTKTCVVILQNEQSERDANVVKLTARTNEFGQQNLEKIFARGTWQHHEAFQSFQIRHKELALGEWRLSPQATLDIANRISKNAKILENLCSCKQGIVTGCDAAFVLNEEEVLEKKIEKSLLVPWIKVGDLNRYNLQPVEKRWLIYTNHLESIEDYPNAKAHISEYKDKLLERRECKSGKIEYFHLQWGRDRKLFSREKLICRFKAERNTFVLDNLPAFSSADTTLVIPNNDCPYAITYLLALVNSKLLTFYFSTYGKLMDYRYEYYPGPVGNLPIFNINFTTPPADRKRLTTKARALFESSIAAKAAAILDFTETELAANHADVIHDFLAYLAAQMTELNAAKQTAAKTFQAALKDFHGIEARSLTPKTKLDEFWKLETADVFAHFQANKLRIKESDEDKIRSRFQQAKDKLVPLDSQIEFTDTLIDQIVYRLYELTEAEIIIVEGRS
jgi:type I restriction-modification system DNA methylase subunit